MRGLVLIAPHFFTEEIGPRGDPHARARHSHRQLCAKSSSAGTPTSIAPSARGASRGSIRLSEWDITEALGYIRVPILIVQGETISRHAQTGRDGEEECFCPVETRCCPASATCRSAKLRS